MPVTVARQRPSSRLQPPYLRTGQVAALFGVDPKSVLRWAKRGRLPCVRTPGGHRRYPQAAIEALVHELGAALRVEAEASGLMAALVQAEHTLQLEMPPSRGAG